jgi:diguanylate cyclase (GGDEF)-like protein/PAS domain S-box-containing protein
MMDNPFTKENPYQALFKNHRNAFLIVEPNSGIIVHVNKAACDFYGYTCDELTSLNINQINCLSDQEIKAEMLKAVKEERNFFYFSHRLKSGEIREVEIISNPVTINEETFLFSIVTDVKKRNQQHQQMQDVFMYSPNAISILDEQGKFISVNHSFVTLFGYELEEMQTKSLYATIIPPGIEDNEVLKFNEVFSGQVCNCETLRRTKDGQLIYVRIMAIPHIQNNVVKGVQVIYTDITEEVEQNHELRLFKEVIQHNTDGVMITNSRNEIEWINNAFSHITGYTLDEVKGRNPKFLSSSIQNKSFYQGLWKSLLEKGSWQGDIWNKRKNGRIYPEWLHIFSIKNNQNEITNYVGIFKDLESVHNINKKILLMIQKDPLTSLYNRTYFDEQLEQVQHKNDERFLLFLDVNDFKPINDQYGHLVGDQLLIQFANVLITHFKKDLVARYAGDEFVILMHESTSKDEVEQLLISFSEKLETPLEIDELGKALIIKCSVGIAEYPLDTTSLQELTHKADQAMYKAKELKLPFLFFQDIKTLN